MNTKILEQKKSNSWTPMGPPQEFNYSTSIVLVNKHDAMVLLLATGLHSFVLFYKTILDS